jgi:hypothetical protein
MMQDKQPKPAPEFMEQAIATMDGAGLVKILKDPSSSEFQKAKACQRVAELGVTEAIPALAPLLADEHLNTYARHALEPLADPSASEVLRSALGKLPGNLLIGVIHSLGTRKDAASVERLTKLMYANDADVARAAANSLGKIGGPAAMRELQAGLGKTKGMVRMAVADAGLLCAEGLLAQGQRQEAMAMYHSLTAPDVPKSVRLAAMHGVIAAETALTRPR